MKDTLRDTLLAQNPLMLLLASMSVVALAIVLDRLLFWLASSLRYRPLPIRALARDDAQRQRAIAQLRLKRGKHYLREILLVCLTSPGNDEKIAQTVSEQLDVMSARLGTLDLIARIAPLLGILGTVVGMATSFGGIGAMTAASPAAISNGISVALKTTAYGLVISIAASVAAAGFRRLTHRATLRMGRIICECKDQ